MTFLPAGRERPPQVRRAAHMPLLIGHIKPQPVQHKQNYIV